MQQNEILIASLNDLIRINNERFEIYTKALRQASETDKELKALLLKLANESRKNTSVLLIQVSKFRTSQVTGAGLTGGVYGEWRSKKLPFVATDRNSILSYCECLEKLVQQAYYNALNRTASIPENIVSVLISQKHEIKSSHFVINNYQKVESLAA